MTKLMNETQSVENGRNKMLKELGIIDVLYVSVWNGGYEIKTKAKYDVKTKEVFDIESVEAIDEDGDEVETLDEEYIILPNGEELSVIEVNGDYIATESIKK